MKHASRSIAAGVMVGVVTILGGSPSVWAQLSVDSANQYANVGAIMVWRVDDAGEPTQLLAFVSGTLIRDRVLVTAGHFTAPVKALGAMPPSTRAFASFSATNAQDRSTWIPVIGMATHPSMPPCPPPPQCDPTDDVLVAPLEPGIADVGLVFLERAPSGIQPARLADPGTLDGKEGTPTTIVGYGVTTPREGDAPPDPATWDAKRRTRTSALRRVVDETWALWAVPGYVCHGDSGGAIFLDARADRSSGGDRLVANVSDGGNDCRSHNNNNRLDTAGIQSWIDEAIGEQFGERR
jgi:hypothetical protein